MNKKLDINLLKKLVEEKYSLIKALTEYNPEGQYDFRHRVFCPFHHNENTPAAMLYEGKGDKSDTLYCFAEQRTYTVADVITKLMGYNIYEVGSLLWSDMSDYERQEFLARAGKPDYSTVFRQKETSFNTTELNNLKIMFKEGNLNITDLLNAYVKNKFKA